MLDVDIDITGTDSVVAALRGAQPEVRAATVPIMEMSAISIAAKAKASVNTSRTHGLWSGKRGRTLSPKYTVKAKGPYWYRIETPTGATGKALALAEFAGVAVTPQGAALIRSLSSVYGRGGGSGGGRILWQAKDDLDASLYAAMQRAVEAAAAEIERKATGK